MKKNILYLKTKKADAKGIKLNDKEFLLLKGSKINDKTCPSLPKKLKTPRDSCIKHGSVKNFITMNDMKFSSVSSAAKFVVGYNVNGWVSWKNEDGKKNERIRILNY